MTRKKAKQKATAAIKAIMQAAFELHEAQEELLRPKPIKSGNREGKHARNSA
jgi:hypothetical protein